MIKIKNFKELSKIEPSNTHFIEVYENIDSGWVHNKSNEDRGFYLSTHTFYNERNTDLANEKLKKCGFCIELIPWE